MEDMLCHSRENSSPGYVVPAPVFLLDKRELGDTFGIPAFAGMPARPRPLPAAEKQVLHSAQVFQSFQEIFQRTSSIAGQQG
jgi:hypothetical protein